MHNQICPWKSDFETQILDDQSMLFTPYYLKPVGQNFIKHKRPYSTLSSKPSRSQKKLIRPSTCTSNVRMKSKKPQKYREELKMHFITQVETPFRKIQGTTVPIHLMSFQTNPGTKMKRNDTHVFSNHLAFSRQKVRRSDHLSLAHNISKTAKHDSQINKQSQTPAFQVHTIQKSQTPAFQVHTIQKSKQKIKSSSKQSSKQLCKQPSKQALKEPQKQRNTYSQFNLNSRLASVLNLTKKGIGHSSVRHQFHRIVGAGTSASEHYQKKRKSALVYFNQSLMQFKEARSNA